jgi:saccharopine dehydrogenase-like NADP-dependent oxidoreductase
MIDALPLDGLESFSLDGVHYEAFNTSGGLGTLCETLDGRVRELNYRTVRYRGHRDLMAFLLQDLRLAERREMLKDILERAIPITLQDVVVIFSNVTGVQDGQFVQWSDARKIYNQTISGRMWSAIQITTAAAVCAALDLHVAGRLPQRGFVQQEQIDLNQFLDNRFGRYYNSQVATRFSQTDSGTLDCSCRWVQNRPGCAMPPDGP